MPSRRLPLLKACRLAKAVRVGTLAQSPAGFRCASAGGDEGAPPAAAQDGLAGAAGALRGCAPASAGAGRLTIQRLRWSRCHLLRQQVPSAPGRRAWLQGVELPARVANCSAVKNSACGAEQGRRVALRSAPALLRCRARSVAAALAGRRYVPGWLARPGSQAAVGRCR